MSDRVAEIIHFCFRNGIYIRDIKETDLEYLFDEIEKQRRHRKWALKKARRWYLWAIDRVADCK